MPALSIPSFWSHPVAATRAYFTSRTPLQAVELTFAATTLLYYFYFWYRSDSYSMQLAAGFFMCVSSLLSIWRVQAERLQLNLVAPWINVFLGIAVIWLTLATATP